MRRKYFPPWWVEDGYGCWIWQGSLNKKGYGMWRARGTAQIPRTAHRAVYEAIVGPIPAGLHLDHLCRKLACVRPDHLEPVTVAENNRRSNILITHCPKGHAYDAENTRVYNGWRFCRACRTRWDKRTA